MKLQKNCYKRPAIFLDRDGVLNKKPEEGDYVKSINEFFILNNVPEAIKILNDKNYYTIIVTNQRGIGKGLMTEEDFIRIMNFFLEKISAVGAKIDKIYYCPDVDDSSHCRKPNTGMIEQALKDFSDIDLENSFVVGDSRCDMELAKRIKCKFVYIKDNENHDIEADFTFRSLYDFALWLPKFVP